MLFIKILEYDRIEIMFTIVGLGNIGEEYKNTRHNIGWLVLDYFIHTHNLPALVQSGKMSGKISVGRVGEKDVLILFPSTFMNKSGTAVKKALTEYPNPEKLIIVHDEIDLPLGEVRIAVGRGSGGHNGVQSVIDTLGTKDFVRVRVGIGEKNIFGMLRRPQGEALSKFVLGEFKKRDMSTLESINEKVASAILAIIETGVEKAMNTCNS